MRDHLEIAISLDYNDLETGFDVGVRCRYDGEQANHFRICLGRKNSSVSFPNYLLTATWLYTQRDK